MEREDWWEDYIEVDPAIMVGKPVVKGSRITVEHILMVMSAGWTTEDVLANHPTVTKNGIHAALAFAQSLVRERQSTGISVG